MVNTERMCIERKGTRPTLQFRKTKFNTKSKFSLVSTCTAIGFKAITDLSSQTWFLTETWVTGKKRSHHLETKLQPLLKLAMNNRKALLMWFNSKDEIVHLKIKMILFIKTQVEKWKLEKTNWDWCKSQNPTSDLTLFLRQHLLKVKL